MDKYVSVKQIGRGSFGKCVLVQRKLDKKLFVLKEVNVQEMSPNERKEAMNEVNVLSVLRHPNIIAYHESFVAEGLLNIVMEYAEGGDLHQAIQKRQNEKNRYFTELEIMEWFCQIALALQYTHQKNILHRDLKTQNIFLSSNKTVKLGDFGIAKVLNSDTEFAKTIIGTPYYLSPEMCEDQPYDHKSDIWALGCVLYEMTTLRHAFDAHNLPALVLKILKGDYPPIPQLYSKDLSSLVRSMLRTEPVDRPSINEILTTTYVLKYLPNVQQQNNAANPRKQSAPVSRTKPVSDPTTPKRPSPEKLQMLKLRNEPKAVKSKENGRKGVNSPSPIPKVRLLKSSKSAASPPTSTRTRTSPKSATSPISSPRAAASSSNGTMLSPRSRTPPVGDATLSPRSQQNSPRPYSSPAVPHRTTNPAPPKQDSVHVPTPRPPQIRSPDVAVGKNNSKKFMTHQRAKSEPTKRTPTNSPSGAAVQSKKPVPVITSPPPPKPTALIAKKRVALNLELKQHEQKFKDNLKCVKSRIARDNLKPFQNANKTDEPLSPTSEHTAHPELLILIPPATPPSSGSISAPVTPTHAPSDPFAQPARARTQLGGPRKATSTTSSPAAAASPARGALSPPSAQTPVTTQSTLRATSGAAAIKAAAASQALLRKQKSFTAKTETLKEVIKKNRRQIKKTGGDDVAVEIMLPKHMEHLLRTQSNPDIPSSKDIAQDSEVPALDLNAELADLSLSPSKTGSDGTDAAAVVDISNNNNNTEGQASAEASEKSPTKDTNNNNNNNNNNETTTTTTTTTSDHYKGGRNNYRDVRLSTDLSDKMDKLSVRIETLRQKCEQVFGEEVFFKVYKYLREMKQDDDKETLPKIVGQEKLGYLRYVDQLIFCELQFYGS